jgi:hypothetical protein
MIPGSRYELLRSRLIVAREAAEIAPAMPEHELQSLWFSGAFGRDFTSTDGRRVTVVQFGVWNHESGPDFAEAAVSVDGAPPVRGHIELDPDARDWERHGHSTNPEYNGVVLHVFFGQGEAESFTRTTAHRLVPQVRLSLAMIDDPPTPQPEAKPGRCVGPLRDLPEAKVRDVLRDAALYRMRRKGAALLRVEEIHGADEMLFQALAGTLGYKSNKLPFTLLAQRLPLKLLRAAKDDAPALLFGVAGFLNQSDLAPFDSPTRAYLRGLWEKWWPRRAEFERLSVPLSLWKMSGGRPMNHPQRRLAALAQLVAQWPRIRALRAACLPDAISDFCAELHDDYWDTHYTVTSKPAAKRMALIGETRVTEMLANVFFPLALATTPERWSEFAQLPASLTNKRVEIAALRLFGTNPLGQELLKKAAFQQGLLQVYEDFCQRDASDCQRCLFPEQLAGW